jgi:hypothetical protein
MSGVIAGLLAEFWKPLAAIVGGLLVGLGVYAKGRSDATSKAKLEDITNANDIRKDGAAARAGADTGKLSDDGWRRD